jgi:hypothetical protein
MHTIKPFNKISKDIKFFLGSDTHLDELNDPIKSCIIDPDPDADFIILPGDIGEKFSHIEWLKHYSENHPVIYVPGNHCIYRDRMYRKEEKLREKLLGHDVTILNKGVVEYGNFVIIGATMWSDFSLYPDRIQEAKRDYDATMQDKRLIKTLSCRKFIANLAQTESHKHQFWIKEQLEKYKDKKCIVVTHNAPSILSISEDLRGHIDAACYANNLDDFIRQHPQIVVWCHGHNHESVDYFIGSTRVICNPFKGMYYEPTWHNPKWNNNLHIKVN